MDIAPDSAGQLRHIYTQLQRLTPFLSSVAGAPSLDTPAADLDSAELVAAIYAAVVAVEPILAIAEDPPPMLRMMLGRLAG